VPRKTAAARAGDVPKKASRPASKLADLLPSLRRMILRGRVKPGAPLRQDELAASFGISKIPVREALLQLVAEGLVALQPNRGFTVAHLAADEASEILEIRAVLECEALRLAMPAMTEAGIAEAKRILDEAGQVSSLDRWSDLNWAFHNALYTSANRPRMFAVLRQISNPTDAYIRVLISNSNYRGQAEREHRAILAACEVGNADAAVSLLNQHIRQTGILLASFLRDPLRSIRPGKKVRT
jgi:DNA-binding GntR family transcriptional regulator